MKNWLLKIVGKKSAITPPTQPEEIELQEIHPQPILFSPPYFELIKRIDLTALDVPYYKYDNSRHFKPNIFFEPIDQGIHTFLSKLPNINLDNFKQKEKNFYKDPFYSKYSQSKSWDENTKLTIEDSQGSILPAEKNKVVILTEMLYGLGDFFAAYKLINYLNSHFPSLKIVWIIYAGEQIVPKEQNDLQVAEIIIIQNANVTPDIFNHVNTAAIALAFPTCHYLPIGQFQYYRKGKVAMLHCTEYDFGSGLQMPHQYVRLDSGLGPNRLGMFLASPSRDSREQEFQQLPKSIRLVLSADEDYFSKHELFFGYGSNHNTQVGKTNAVNYLRIVSQLVTSAAYSDKTSIDIVMPFTPGQIEQALSHNELKVFSKVQFINKSGDVIRQQQFAESGMTLRVLDLFKLDHDTMTRFIRMANPFIFCTGDQSLSEVMSRSGIPFYQVMSWKCNLIVAMEKLADQVCGTDSALVQYFKSMRLEDVNDIKKITTLLSDPNLYADIQTLHDYIEQEKNLYSTLPGLLGELAQCVCVKPSPSSPTFFSSSTVSFDFYEKVSRDQSFLRFVISQQLLAKGAELTDPRKETLLEQYQPEESAEVLAPVINYPFIQHLGLDLRKPVHNPEVRITPYNKLGLSLDMTNSLNKFPYPFDLSKNNNPPSQPLLLTC